MTSRALPLLRLDPGPLGLTVGEVERASGSQRRDFHEIAIVRRGRYRLRIDDVPYEAGPASAVVIGVNRVVEVPTQARVDAVAIRFRHETIVVATEGETRTFDLLNQVRPARVLAIPKAERAPVLALVGLLVHEYAQRTEPHAAPLLRRLIYALALKLDRFDLDRVRFGGREDERLHGDFLTLLERHYRTAKRPAFYARALHVTSHRLAEANRAASGAPTVDLIGRRCIVEARRLLASHHTVKEIAAALGYDDPLYFSRVFKRQVGVSPARWRP